jgi:ATP-dependent DNA helicase RecG
MQLAVEEMLKSRSEHHDKADPLVGAVLVSPEGDVLGTAHRGALRTGDHAEYTLIERMLQDRDLEGSSLFVTLEPCTVRGAGKTPCAKRIVMSRIGSVYVGMPDPNPAILGHGINYLLRSGVNVAFFDSDLATAIRRENASFIEYWEQLGKVDTAPEKFEGASSLETDVLNGVSLSALSLGAIVAYLDSRNVKFHVPSDALWKFFEECRFVGRTPDQQLAPTVAGLLLFGSRPADVLPQSRVSLQVEGGLLTEFDGPLVKFRDALQKFLAENLSRVTIIKELHRVEDFSVPLIAVREGVFNAIAHRDYQPGRRVHVEIRRDELVVKSPGSPLKPLSIAKLSSFNAPPFSRNPHLAAVLNHLGWIEEKGSGLERMRHAMEQHGLPPPQFSLVEDYVVLRLGLLKPGSVGPATPLTESQQKAYRLLSKRGRMTTGGLAKALDINARYARRLLNDLVKAGVAKRTGTGRGTTFYPEGKRRAARVRR